MRTIGVLVVVLLLPTSVHADKACDERMNRLEARMKRVASPIEPGPGLFLGPDGKWRTSGTKDEGARTLPLHVFAPATTTLAEVSRAVVDARKAGLRGEARVLVHGSPLPEEPSDAALFGVPSVAGLRKEIADAGQDLSKRAIAMSGGLTRSVPPCAAVVRIFGQMAPTTPNAKTEVAFKIPAAMASCGCAVADINLFEFSMLAVSGAFDPRTTWVPLPAIAAGDKRTVGDLK
jgi:hypothetical protein